MRAVTSSVDLKVTLGLSARCPCRMEPDVWLVNLWAAITWEANGEVVGLGLIRKVAELPRIGASARVLQAGVDVKIGVERVVLLGPEVCEQLLGVARVGTSGGVTLVDGRASCHGGVGVPHHRAGREHRIEGICAHIDAGMRGRGSSLDNS